MNSNYMGIHIPYDGRLTTVYDKVIEITRFEIVSNNEEIEYKKIFIYPAYSCSLSGSTWNVTRDKDSYGNLRYCISKEIGVTDSYFNNTVVNVHDGSEITITNDKKYLKIGAHRQTYFDIIKLYL